MQITVFGAGAWGTALAVHASAHHPTVLWARDAAQAAGMRQSGCNARYLPEVSLPPGLQITADLEHATAHARAGLAVIATPVSGLESMLLHLASRGVPDVYWLCKGFQEGTGRLGHEVAAAVAPQLNAGVLSGPSFAIEVAQGRPTALVAASNSQRLARLGVAAFHQAALRVYTSADPVGVEVGGAVKNVLAIATGIVDGMQLGLNARAALVTRGLAEMTRLGVALGGRAETFTGLSGLGDLVLTATGSLSRNRRVGLLLAEGMQLDRILEELGHVAEGVPTAAMVLQRARLCGVDMPIVEGVAAVIEGRSTPADALQRLMAREARSEH